MENFTPYASLLGGVLIGLSASLLLLFHGRVAGVTGIFAGTFAPGTNRNDRGWRLLFLGGMLFGALLLSQVMGERFELGIERGPLVVVVAGVLVGAGTRLGSGCTSGHGVCGMSRGSLRSLAATATFIATGAVTVYLYRAFTGGI